MRCDVLAILVGCLFLRSYAFGQVGGRAGGMPQIVLDDLDRTVAATSDTYVVWGVFEDFAGREIGQVPIRRGVTRLYRQTIGQPESQLIHAYVGSYLGFDPDSFFLNGDGLGWLVRPLTLLRISTRLGMQSEVMLPGPARVVFADGVVALVRDDENGWGMCWVPFTTDGRPDEPATWRLGDMVDGDGPHGPRIRRSGDSLAWVHPARRVPSELPVRARDCLITANLATRTIESHELPAEISTMEPAANVEAFDGSIAYTAGHFIDAATGQVTTAARVDQALGFVGGRLYGVAGDHKLLTLVAIDPARPMEMEVVAEFAVGTRAYGAAGDLMKKLPSAFVPVGDAALVWDGRTWVRWTPVDGPARGSP